jgi:hypothetical protein
MCEAMIITDLLPAYIIQADFHEDKIFQFNIFEEHYGVGLSFVFASVICVICAFLHEK